MTDPAPQQEQNAADHGVPESSVLADVGKVTADKPIDSNNKPQEKRAKSFKSFFAWPMRMLGIPGQWWSALKDPAVSNRTIAIATVVVAVATGFTWWEVHQGGKQTDKIVVAADDIRLAIRRGNRQNRAAAQRTLWQSEDALERTLARSKEAMDESNKQSNAALTASIKASRLDQRP